MLKIDGLVSAYGRIEVLHGVNLDVNAGEVVALVGSNGAGKTTLLRALSGVQPIKAGTVLLDGENIEKKPPFDRVRRGLTQVPEGRQIFPPLSVADNLALGAWTCPSKVDTNRKKVYELFPILSDFSERQAGSLSGGQQQMLAMGRALMADPRVLLLDEPTMGLAPIMAQQVLDIICTIRDMGTTVLVVEQSVQAVLQIADRGYVIERGVITMEGSASELLNDPKVNEAYLGA